MASQTTPRKRGPRTTNSGPVLTPDEQELQRSRGRHYRSLLSQAVADLLKGVDRSRVGIMLSGGVDSTTTLWTLLEQGVRPYVYTFHLPVPRGEERTRRAGLGSDAHKAKALAEKYRLPFRVVELPDVPNELAEIALNLNDRYPLMRSRADFESLIIIEQMMKAARDQDDVRVVFSGIADGTVHLTDRKLDIRARGGLMSLHEANARRVFHLRENQTPIMLGFATDLGMRLCLPLLMVAAQQPYYGVPWHVMHTPRKKAITIMPWDKEEAASGIKVVPQPLQTGDSGAREYYDDMLPLSSLARSMSAPKSVTSAVVFWNTLRDRHGEGGSPKREHIWDWFNHVVAGMPLPANYEPFVKRDDGLADPPEEDDGIDLFGLEDPPEYKLDAEGNPDLRVDCFGNPFYDGDDVTLTNCPRARAGLCGRFHPEVPYLLHRCEAWTEWNQGVVDYLREVALLTSGSTKQAYLTWADRAERAIAEIATETHSFG